MTKKILYKKDDTEIVESKIPIIIKKLIQKSKNVFEWSTLFMGIIFNYHHLIDIQFLDNNTIDQLLDYLIEFRRTSIPIIDVINTFPNILLGHNIDSFYSKYGLIIRENIIQFINYQKQFQNISIEKIYPIPDNYYSFTGTKLMSYFFNKPMEKDKFLDSLSDIQSYQPKESFPLQALEIAINEGTNKPFLESILTETVQNSLDAVRTEKPTKKNIDINITKTENKPSSIILSIIDYVGIPDIGLLSLKIPFLSSKTPSEIVTGEMGSGFFNVYRESTKVIIETKRDGRRIIIHDTPIKSTSGRIIDVDTKISVIPDKSKQNFTKISILIDFSDPLKMIKSISNIIYFTTQVLGLILESEIHLNNKSIQIPLKSLQVNNNKDFQFFIQKKPLDIFPSYIMTKGVPFGNLYEYFSDKNIISTSILEEIRNNVTFNIRHGVYTPVQSRTQLNIKTESLIQLKKFIADSAYLTILINILNNKTTGNDRFLPNLTSGASASQLSFGDTLGTIDISSKDLSISDFIIKYQYTYSKSNGTTKYSLGSIINKGIKIMNNSIFDIKENEIKKVINTKNYPKLMVDVAILWLTNKNKSKQVSSYVSSTSTSVSIEKVKESFDKYLPNINTISKFTKIFIEEFWKIGYTAQQNKQFVGTHFTTNPPGVEWVNEIEFLGAYIPNKHKIVMSKPSLFNINNYTLLTKSPENSYLIQEIINKLNRLVPDNISALNDNNIYREWFGIEYPASTLVHELSHAWRNTTHSLEGSHGNITLSIGQEKNKNFNFEDAANKVFLFILQNGFFEKIKMKM